MTSEFIYWLNEPIYYWQTRILIWPLLVNCGRVSAFVLRTVLTLPCSATGGFRHCDTCQREENTSSVLSIPALRELQIWPLNTTQTEESVTATASYSKGSTLPSQLVYIMTSKIHYSAKNVGLHVHLEDKKVWVQKAKLKGTFFHVQCVYLATKIKAHLDPESWCFSWVCGGTPSQ